MNGRTNVTSGTNIDILEVPLDPVTKFVAEEGTGKILLSWNDPKDKYATPEGEMAQDPQQLVSVWSHTVIVRKEGSDPVDENDGVVVISSSVRNQYVSTQYTDANVSNGIEYHYGAFAINEDGIASDGVYSSATPRVYDTVLANNTWAQIDEACSLGIAESFWEIGDTHTVTIDEEIYTVNIIDFNHDDLADGSGKATITFGTKELVNKPINMANSTAYTSDNATYNNSKFPNMVQSNTYDLMDASLQSVIKDVNKYTGNRWIHTSSYNTVTRQASAKSHKVFLFSEIEVCNTVEVSSSNEGTQYSYFSTSANRIKRNDDGDGGVSNWWLRSSYGKITGGTISTYYTDYSQIGIDGDACGSIFEYNSYSGTGSYTNLGSPNRTSLQICFGFCIGKSTA